VHTRTRVPPHLVHARQRVHDDAVRPHHAHDVAVDDVLPGRGGEVVEVREALLLDARDVHDVDVGGDRLRACACACVLRARAASHATLRKVLLGHNSSAVKKRV
jgi:hypothetical protein